MHSMFAATIVVDGGSARTTRSHEKQHMCEREKTMMNHNAMHQMGRRDDFLQVREELSEMYSVFTIQQIMP